MTTDVEALIAAAPNADHVYALAARIAREHPLEAVERAVYVEPSGARLLGEFRAVLLQDLVMTGAPVEGSAPLRAFGRRLVAEGHPLGALPLHLLPEEGGLTAPPGPEELGPAWVLRHLTDRAAPRPELLVTPAMTERAARLDPVEVTVPATAEAMGAAVRHWCTESNGRVAAHEFWLPDPVAPEDFPALFARLPLTAFEERPAVLRAADPDQAFRLLLTAASLGAAYGGSPHRAYGRLAAWRSLAALTGAPADAPVDRVAELVRRAHWFRPDPVSPWFADVIWDLALAALHSDGHRITVLTATDTD